MTLAQATLMVEAVAAAGVVCLPLQSSARLRYAGLKDRIDRGLIGDIIVLHQTARWSIAEHWPRAGAPGWFADPACVPGGAFIDEGIYWIDFFRWLTGSEVVEVDGQVANLVHPGLAVEDWGFASFTFANGVRATLEAGWTITVPRATGPSPKQNSVVRLEVIGTRGELTDQWFRAPGLALLAAGADDWRYERQSEDLFTPSIPAPFAHLIDCLETGGTPMTTLHDARTSLAVALAVYESAREGRRVRLDTPPGLGPS
jgi:predicted dehydrogenase